MKEAIENFIADCKQNPSTKPHCYILYRVRGVGPSTTKYIDKVYQTLEDFETRGVERMLAIPSEFGVYVEIYEFD